MEALYKEVKAFKPFMENREVSSIFIGGGTPSVVEPWLLGRVLGFIKENYNL